MNVLKIATLNINGIHTPTTVAMLHNFLRYQDLEILFLQVTHPDIGELSAYVTHTNVGTTMTGTVFVKRNELQVTNITKLPSGRGIAAKCERIRLLNAYATSGVAKEAERESFFNTDLVYLLHSAPSNLLLDGEFKCVLEASDTTVQCTFGKL